MVSTNTITNRILTFFLTKDEKMETQAWVVLSAAIAFATAVIGGTLSQGKAAAVALEGIARNPAAAEKLQTPMILALALIESLVLFGFGVAFLILQRFPV
jgi:F-type H+-transporting ATPase subunit c